MDNSANKSELDSPSMEDYKEADKNQPAPPKRPTIASLKKEQELAKIKVIRKKDPITQKFKRIKTDGLRRSSYYSDTGKVLE